MRKKPLSLRIRAELYAVKHRWNTNWWKAYPSPVTAEGLRDDLSKAYLDGYRQAQRDIKRRK